MERTFMTTNYKTIQRNKKVNDTTRWRLYQRMFVGLWICQKHHRLITVDLSGQKEWHADPKVIQQIEFIRQLKKTR